MNREQLLHLIENSSPAVRTALTTLYARQTDDERSGLTTRHNNGQGFNYADAEVGSSLAQWVLARKPLSGPQMRCARRFLPKYATQLLASGVDWEAVALQRDYVEMSAMEALALDLQEANTK